MPISNLASRRLDLPDDLVTRLRAREEKAFRQLLDLAFGRLVAFAGRIVESSDVAEDVVQDVLVRIARQGEEFNPKGELAAYLYTAVRNSALDVIKSRTREQARITKVSRESSYNVHESVETWERLDEFIGRLTERQRTAVHLRYMEHRTIPEISHILGISITAVNQLLRRAITMLKEDYSKDS